MARDRPTDKRLRPRPSASIAVCRMMSSRPPQSTCNCVRSPRKTERLTTTGQTLIAAAGGVGLRRRCTVRTDITGLARATRPCATPCNDVAAVRFQRDQTVARRDPGAAGR